MLRHLFRSKLLPTPQPVHTLIYDDEFDDEDDDGDDLSPEWREIF
jgi:hypothetical protein